MGDWHSERDDRPWGYESPHIQKKKEEPVTGMPRNEFTITDTDRYLVRSDGLNFIELLKLAGADKRRHLVDTIADEQAWVFFQDDLPHEAKALLQVRDTEDMHSMYRYVPSRLFFARQFEAGSFRILRLSSPVEGSATTDVDVIEYGHDLKFRLHILPHEPLLTVMTDPGVDLDVSHLRRQQYAWVKRRCPCCAMPMHIRGLPAAGCSARHENKDCLCAIGAQHSSLVLEYMMWNDVALAETIKGAPSDPEQRVFVGPGAIDLKRAIAAAEVLIDVHLGSKTFEEEQVEREFKC